MSKKRKNKEAMEETTAESGAESTDAPNGV
jgi:hypothetical protein